jgi:hypothetical protein
MKPTSKKFPVNTKAKIKRKISKDKVVEMEMEKCGKQEDIEVRDFKVKKRTYKERSIACDLIGYFKDKIAEKGKDIYVSQDEILRSMMKIGYSRSYIYNKLKEFSQGKIKIDSDKENTNPDIYEPLLIKKHRDLFDGVIGWVYKVNDRWKNIPVEQIKYVFNGE